MFGSIRGEKDNLSQIYFMLGDIDTDCDLWVTQVIFTLWYFSMEEFKQRN